MRAEFLTLNIEAKNSAEDELKKLKKSLDDIERETDGFTRAQKKSAQATENVNDRLKEEEERLRELRRRLNAAATASGRAGGAFGSSASSLLRGASAAGKFGVAAAGVAEAFNLIGSAARVGARGIELQLDLLKDAILTASKFNQEIARVTAVVGGSAKDFELLRSAAVKGGASTLFTAKQAGEGLRFLAQAGFDAQKSAAALPGTLQLAGAGMLSLADAANIATNVLTGYGLEVEDLGRVNDVLVKASTTSNTNVKQLGNAFSFAAGIASSTKQELEGITAVLSVLANSAIPSTKAGRAVRTAIERIVKPTAEAAAALRRFDIATKDSRGETRELTEVLEELAAKGAEAQDIIAIFGRVAGGNLLNVVNALQKDASALDKFKNSFLSASGTAERFQKQLQDTGNAQLQIFLSTIETLSTQIGGRFDPALKESAKVLSSNAASLAKNNEFLKQFDIIAIDAVAAGRELLLVSSEIIPVFVVLGGVTLEVAKNLRLVALGFKIAGRGILATTGNFQLATQGIVDDFERVAELTGEASGDFGDSLNASVVIADDLRTALRSSASGMEFLEKRLRSGASAGFELESVFESVPDAFQRLEKALESNAEEAKKNAKALEENRRLLKRSPIDLAVTAKAWRSFEADIASTARTLESFYQITQGTFTPQAPEPLAFPEPDLSPKERAVEIAEIELRLAKSTNEEERARLTAAIKLKELKTDQADEELRELARKRIFVELDKQIAGLRKKRAPRGPSKRELAFLNDQARIEREILLAVDERQKIELRAAKEELAIAERVRKKQITAEQARTARLKVSIDSAEALQKFEDAANQAVLDAEKKRLDLLQKERAAAANLLALRAQIAKAEGSSPAQVRELELAAKIAQINATNASEVEKAQQRKLANLESENDARREESSLQVRLLELDAKRLGLSTKLVDQIESEKSALQAEILSIKAEGLSSAEEEQKIAIARLETERAIAAAKYDQVRANAALVSATISSVTNTSGVQSAVSDDAARREQARSAELEQLRARGETAREGGADTSFLERRIELLEREAELEQQNQELIQNRLSVLTELGSGLAAVTEQSILASKAAKDTEEAYEAQASALSAATQLAGALTGAFVKDLKRRALINAGFESAAAIAAYAGYAASNGTAVNLLSAGIQHTAAAVKFGVVAGTAGRSASGAGSASGSSSGSVSGVASTQTPNIDATLARSADAIADAIAAKLDVATETTYNLYLGGTTLANAHDTARELKSALDGAEANVVQARVSA